MTTSFALQIELPSDIYLALKRAAADLDISEAEAAAEAIQFYLEYRETDDQLLGLFADEPDFINAVTTDIMESRERGVWRVSD